MPYLVSDIPYRYMLARREFLRAQQDGHGEYEEACAFGVTTIEGRVPAFQAMMRKGAQWARLPFHAFVTKECDPLPLTAICMWDCLSYTHAVHAYSYLETMRCDVFCGDGVTRPGTYWFTLDFAESHYSEMPDQHKQAHIIALDCGNLAAMPNNRIRWREPSWIRPFTERPDYLVQEQVYTAERDRALLDGERQFYLAEGEPDVREDAA